MNNRCFGLHQNFENKQTYSLDHQQSFVARGQNNYVFSQLSLYCVRLRWMHNGVQQIIKWHFFFEFNATSQLYWLHCGIMMIFFFHVFILSIQGKLQQLIQFPLIFTLQRMLWPSFHAQNIPPLPQSKIKSYEIQHKKNKGAAIYSFFPHTQRKMVHNFKTLKNT